MADRDYEDRNWELDPELEAAEDDGRDGSPTEGSSDAPENMDQDDPLRSENHRADRAMGDLDGSGSEVIELTEADDSPEW